MIRILSTLLLTSITLPSFAQDTIRHLSGEIIVGKVIANKQHFIEFSYPSETSLNSIPKTLIQSVVYSSGRKETVSGIIDTSGETGWKNVLIAISPDEVAGLVSLGEVKAKADNTFNLSDVSGADSKATERIKKQAAGLGGYIILMLQDNTKGSSYATGAQSFKSGIAYGYPFKTIDSKLPYSSDLARRYYGIDKSEANKDEVKDAVGKKVLFDYDGKIVEGVIVKRYGNFYKIKYLNQKGREENLSRHIDKVEISSL